MFIHQWKCIKNFATLLSSTLSLSTIISLLLRLRLHGHHRKNICKSLISNYLYTYIYYYYYPRHWSPSNGIKATGQSIRAYHFWHHNEMTLDSMCRELSVRKKEGGLKPSTVMWVNMNFFSFLSFFQFFFQHIYYWCFESRSISSVFSAKADQTCPNGYGVMDLS
jgi:hypothetical protein